jgi:hypothetical protein
VDSFSLVKKGYNPDEVDRYIATLEQVIKSYKEKDNAIKNAIISAQIAADNVIKNAELQAEEYKTKTYNQLQVVKESIDKQRMRLQAFQDIYNGLIKKYLREIDSADMDELYGKLDVVENMINALVDADKEPEPEVPKAVIPPIEPIPPITPLITPSMPLANESFIPTSPVDLSTPASVLTASVPAGDND